MIKKIINNKLNIFLGIILAFILYNNNLFSSGSLISGTIQLPKEINNKNLCIYYKGKIAKISKDDNFFIFKDDEYYNSINIIFVKPENIELKSKENTILSLYLSNNNNYKFYELKQYIGDTGKKLLDWDIQEIKLIKKDNKKIEIPLNTIIIPWNPNLLKIKFNKITNKLNSNIANLPQIKILIEKNNIKDATDQLLDSCLAFIDIKSFHAKQDKKEINQDNLQVCMILG